MSDHRAMQPLVILDDVPGARVVPVATAQPTDEVDPAAVILTCANCGAPMDERKCKLICSCGYFLSCSDYY
jgi:hypothetical protein